MVTFLTLLIFAALFLLSGLFSGSEIALFSLNRSAIKELVRQKRPGAAAIAKLKDKPHRLLATILIGNNVANIYAAALATQITIETFGSRGVGIATGVVTFFILLFGEIFPKSLAQAYAQSIALRVSRPLLLLTYILWPIVLLLEWLSHNLVRLIPGDHSSSMGIEDEIKSLLLIGMEEGSTEAFEKDFIERLFKFDDTPVSDIMIPYDKAVMVDGEAEINQIARWLADSGYSRFPVYEGSRQNLIGMLHVKDVFRANNSERRDDMIKTLARDAVTVKETEKLDDGLDILRAAQTHSALVKDKEGKIVGFVTMEDMLERLVGDIRDEFDKGKMNLDS